VPKFSKPLAHRIIPDWEPTLTEIAHRANVLWHQDGCPLSPDLVYSVRARRQLTAEHIQLMTATAAAIQIIRPQRVAG
jgi:hypothetical protein